jgi:hypothetical protein
VKRRQSGVTFYHFVTRATYFNYERLLFKIPKTGNTQIWYS